MRIVALEEAFWVDGLQTPGSLVAQHPPLKPDALQVYASRLIDFTAYRLPDMDRCGIDVQVLSLTSPGVQMQADTTAAVEDAKAANDFLAESIGQHPGRFAGLAALPLQDPERAAEELRRAVRDLGLSGRSSTTTR
jgi:2,3-dihydroxybenzoate decarboxylase